LRLVEADNVRVALAGDPLRDVPAAATGVEHAARRDLGDRLDAERQRIRALRPAVDGGARLQPPLVLVVLAGDVRVVELQARPTNAWPGMPRFGAFPPSHAFTVAPTSANSPSCRR